MHSDDVASFDQLDDFFEGPLIRVLRLVAQNLELVSVTDNVDENEVFALSSDGLDSAGDCHLLFEELVVFLDDWIELLPELHDVVLGVELVWVGERVFCGHQCSDLLASELVVL